MQLWQHFPLVRLVVVHLFYFVHYLFIFKVMWASDWFNSVFSHNDVSLQSLSVSPAVMSRDTESLRNFQFRIMQQFCHRGILVLSSPIKTSIRLLCNISHFIRYTCSTAR